ncbi:voltage-gated sodium channel [Desulfitispora alkaliphila]|uniref:ion transporter n=1 Tax=Desulfitispora alkaliphila TaxID=622674 RepID=UPI003D20795E
MDSLRAKLLLIVNHSLFTSSIIGLILVNAVIVGMETYPSIYEPNRDLFLIADTVLLWIFTLEITIRILASKPYRSFFKDGWNIFDFLIVASGHILVGAHFVTVLRILRLLRVLRAISVIPSLRRLVSALLMTIPSLGNIMLLLSLIFYIFAVLGTMLFSEVSPEYFGTLHATLLTLFQVVTLESWASAVMRPIVEQLPWAWMYFVGFILVGTFVIFNLFVGVIVANVEKAEEESQNEATANELKELRKQVSELTELMKENVKK